MGRASNLVLTKYDMKGNASTGKSPSRKGKGEKGRRRKEREATTKRIVCCVESRVLPGSAASVLSSGPSLRCALPAGSLGEAAL